MKSKIIGNNLIRKGVLYVVLYLATATIIASIFLWQPLENKSFPVFRLVIVFFASVLLTKYFVYMALSPFYDLQVMLRTIRYRRILPAYKPKVSVVIPAWNEEVGILTTVRSLLKNTYENLEIIIVNDGSTDNSDALIRAFIAEYEARVAGREFSKKIVYHYKENGGKGNALNAGILLSTGDIIMSIDADCIVTRNAVRNFVRCFVDPTVMAAVGNVKIGNTKTILGTIQYLEFLFSFYFKRADSVLNTIYIIGGAAGAFRREVFDKIGLYNPKNITEDIELSVRIQAAGMRIVYAEDAVVYTEGAVDLQGLMRQRLRWKRGRFETFRDHKYLFFSPNRNHNKVLSWVVLPLALFGEVQLFGELIFILFLYIYASLTHDFLSFLSGIVVVSSMFVVQMSTDEANRRNIPFLLMAPIGWLLFYLSTFVEYNALVKSLWGFYKNHEVRWQKWQRQGVIDKV